MKYEVGQYFVNDGYFEIVTVNTLKEAVDAVIGYVEDEGDDAADVDSNVYTYYGYYIRNNETGEYLDIEEYLRTGNKEWM